MPGTVDPQEGIQGFWAQIQGLTQRIANLEVWQRTQPTFHYFAGAGKTTVTDADFGMTPPDGTTAVHSRRAPTAPGTSWPARSNTPPRPPLDSRSKESHGVR
jgi:hypothetical protein